MADARAHQYAMLTACYADIFVDVPKHRLTPDRHALVAFLFHYFTGDSAKLDQQRHADKTHTPARPRALIGRCHADDARRLCA